MIPIEQAFTLDLSASCSVDQAVLRLIGWGRDTVYLSGVKLTGEGEFLKGHKLDRQKNYGLDEFLSELYQRALSQYAGAMPDEPTEKELQQALASYAYWIDETEAFIEKARSYKMDIVDELASGAESALKVDKEATEKHGTTYITIKSLDAWSRVAYSTQSDAAGEEPDSDLHVFLESLQDVDGTKKSDLSLYVTLALAVQAFAKKAGPKYLHSGGLVNVLQVSEHLASIGAELNPQEENLAGQGLNSIKNRIDKALERLRMVQKH